MHNILKLSRADGSTAQFKSRLMLPFCIFTLLSGAIISCVQTDAATAPVSAPGSSSAQKAQPARQLPKLEPGLLEKAQRAGTVRVLVALSIDVGASQEVLDKAKDELIGQLGGTTYKILHRLEFIPGIALEVGSNALVVLGASPLVKHVQESQIRSLP
jgi:hypothetical protein